MASALEVIKRHLEEKTTSLNDAWSTTAEKFGWKKDLLAQVSIANTENGFAFDYPESMTDQVMTAEYGDGPNPPKAAMRNFKQENPEQEKAAIYDAFSEYITGKGLL